jgi:CheY-specific phosphatase CheX
MDALALMPADAQPIDAEVRARILTPFLVAVETALREVALTDSSVRAACQIPSPRLHGEVVATLELSSGAEGCLALGVSNLTAAALARRVLSETRAHIDDALICDCLGEIANVTAGQAKALLHGTPYQFTFGTPHTAAAARPPAGDIAGCLMAVMATDVGDVVVQLFLKTTLAG